VTLGDQRPVGANARVPADMLGDLVVAVVADAAPERDILCRLMRAETVVYELLDQRVVVRVAAMNRHWDAETVSGHAGR
jgi:hypothetical protein